MCLQKTSEVVTAKSQEVGNLATVELVFPFQSIPLVTVSIPQNCLPLCGPKTLSHYHCQVPQYILHFAQKGAACNHVLV